jgi:hypothetical protein
MRGITMNHRESLVGEALGGAASGLAGTIPMTAVMLAGKLVHRDQPVAPSEILRNAERIAGIEDNFTESEHQALTAISHAAYGAAMGGIFGVAGPFNKPIASGVAFGLLVYACSYLGYLPELKFMPRPENDTPERQTAIILSHVVWGACLGLAYEFLRARITDSDSTAASTLQT